MSSAPSPSTQNPSFVDAEVQTSQPSNSITPVATPSPATQNPSFVDAEVQTSQPSDSITPVATPSPPTQNPSSVNAEVQTSQPSDSITPAATPSPSTQNPSSVNAEVQTSQPSDSITPAATPSPPTQNPLSVDVEVQTSQPSDSTNPAAAPAREPIQLKVRRIQTRWDADKKGFITREEETEPQKDKEEVTCDISIVRNYVQDIFKENVKDEIHIHSPILISIVKTVLKSNELLNLQTSSTVKIEKKEFLAYLPVFRKALREKSLEIEELRHLQLMIDFIDKEYRDQLREIADLRAEEMVTYDLLWSLFVRGEIIVTHSLVTGDPLAIRLVDTQVISNDALRLPHEREGFDLVCEFVNVDMCRPGLAQTTINIPPFKGVRPIRDLPAFPLAWLKDPKQYKADLIQRGKRHWELVRQPWCHMDYNGIAYQVMTDRDRLIDPFTPRPPNNQTVQMVVVKSRIILDRMMFDRYSGSFTPKNLRFHYGDAAGVETTEDKNLKEEDFLLFPTTVHGYALSDRKWMEFRVSDVKDIYWNDKIFDNLELPQDTKEMILAMVKTQTSGKLKFDDFVLGKGMGLIFNLHGPPGVGKTLTAEAISEVTRSALYLISAGDLGVTAESLDPALSRISALAFRWKAIALIDEADVFLERRQVDNVERNAMVAVFLRHLEYYPGILFLTTNRVSVFDEAIKSRIHISLFYDRLSPETREHLWDAFLSEADPQFFAFLHEKPKQKKILRNLPLNGREIKSVVKTAAAMALYDSQREMRFDDLIQAIQTLNWQPIIDGETETQARWRLGGKLFRWRLSLDLWRLQFPFRSKSQADPRAMAKKLNGHEKY
ncbi:hypothetical protein D9758_017849 [Tetrapyrgos nigripes]|uniref:AAA+ ATPase domain-containing protein n=1 Tax=Tetrapyrgos nigripes TaxID=182062 RepID=A0A8H5F9M1_9AGAR|nr:hypothetical protein D9758_017849 [Tetrapyrgos nigripes]